MALHGHFLGKRVRSANCGPAPGGWNLDYNESVVEYVGHTRSDIHELKVEVACCMDLDALAPGHVQADQV